MDRDRDSKITIEVLSGDNLVAVGKRWGVTKERVRQIVAKTLRNARLLAVERGESYTTLTTTPMKNIRDASQEERDTAIQMVLASAGMTEHHQEAHTDGDKSSPVRRVFGKVDLSGWDIGALDDISQFIGESLLKAVEEVLGHAFEGDETYFYFPAEWPRGDGVGGPVVADPLTIYLRVGLEGMNGEKPTYRFNLRDAVADKIEACREDGSFSTGLGRISCAFRELADEIDAARVAPR